TAGSAPGDPLSTPLSTLLVDWRRAALFEHPGRYCLPTTQQLAVQAPVVGLVPLHQGPEARRVVHVPRVAQLVDEQVPHHGRIQEHQAHIEADGAGRRAAAPARALAPDLDAAEAEPELACHRRQLGSELVV